MPPRPRSLPTALRPASVTVVLPTAICAEAAERELSRCAQADDNRCWGYFPSLAGRPGIGTGLPACRDFASAMPEVTGDGTVCRFSFIRLSLRCQSPRPAYHLDSDAATALTGDPATLGQRRVTRILLNLSATAERTLHYLDLDVSVTALTCEGSYVRPSGADPAALSRYAVRAVIPPRSGRTVHGIGFVANRVLHSGVDGARGHFVAAYGREDPLNGTAETSCRQPNVRPAG